MGVSCNRDMGADLCFTQQPGLQGGEAEKRHHSHVAQLLLE